MQQKRENLQERLTVTTTYCLCEYISPSHTFSLDWRTCALSLVFNPFCLTLWFAASLIIKKKWFIGMTCQKTCIFYINKQNKHKPKRFLNIISSTHFFLNSVLNSFNGHQIAAGIAGDKEPDKSKKPQFYFELAASTRTIALLLHPWQDSILVSSGTKVRGTVLLHMTCGLNVAGLL